MEDYIEEMYWEFDGAKKGYGEYKGRPQSERDAFKMMLRKALYEQNKRVAKDVIELFNM